MSNHKNYGQTGISGNTELGKKGPRLKDEGGAIAHRNSADNAYAIARGADPVGDNDLVTKKYLETRANVRVTGQINGGAPGTGAFVGEIRIVTTAGGSFNLQELYRWSGSAWEAVTVFEGMTVVVTDALTGGTDEYLADHIYVWDEDNTTWVDNGPSPALSNVRRARRVTIDFNDPNGANNIGDLIPQNAIVVGGMANVTQAFDDAAATLEVGDAGDTDRFAAVSEICLDVVGLYKFDAYHLYGADTQAIATLAKGTSTQGQVSLILEYIIQ